MHNNAGVTTPDFPTAPALSDLRRRSSAKWQTYPDDVLPMFIAEMDFSLAPPVIDAIVAQARSSDIGYAADAGRVGEVFSTFARRRWGWEFDADDVRLTTDVSVAIVETLRVAIEPGDGVIINPPIYPPFFELVPEAGGRVVEVPLLDDGAYRLDLGGIESALADGAKAVLLCSPHNPVGLCHPREDLARLADLALRYGATVVSDEIHAPLVHHTADFIPFLAVGDAARRVGVALHSASKGFNVAGAKCALMIATDERTRAMLDRQPEEVAYRTSILGRAATEAAFEHGDLWLDTVIGVIDENLTLLESALAQQVPSVTMRRPAASYLAWLDFRATGLGDNPGLALLDEAKLATHYGPAFGKQGKGFARLNVACAPELVVEAVGRIARVVHGAA